MVLLEKVTFVVVSFSRVSVADDDRFLLLSLAAERSLSKFSLDDSLERSDDIIENDLDWVIDL